MQPTDLMLWAVPAGVAASLAWFIFGNLTGADEWLKSMFGKNRLAELEKRIEVLEQRLAGQDPKRS
jgi:hypothetical protein